jgi:DNA repair exonuclease SbcCD nuclease subunit
VYDGDPRVFHAFGVSWLLVPNRGWADTDFNLIVATMVEVAREKHDAPVVVVAHEAVKGSQTDNGYVLNSKLHLDEALAVTYWALGDIHLTQRILSNAFYSGAPYQVDFGEGIEKGVLLVDTEAPTEPQFIELVCPYPLVTVRNPRGRWPEFSRYDGAEDIELPPHVIRVTPDVEEVAVDVQALQSLVPPLWGLEDNLARQSLDDALIPRTLEHAHKMLEDYQMKNA